QLPLPPSFTLFPYPTLFRSGGLAYLVTGMAKVGRIEPIAARLRGPGFAWAGDFIALGVGNGRQAGGGQALCPDALVDDGLLDVTDRKSTRLNSSHVKISYAV